MKVHGLARDLPLLFEYPFEIDIRADKVPDRFKQIFFWNRDVSDLSIRAFHKVSHLICHDTALVSAVFYLFFRQTLCCAAGMRKSKIVFLVPTVWEPMVNRALIYAFELLFDNIHLSVYCDVMAFLPVAEVVPGDTEELNQGMEEICRFESGPSKDGTVFRLTRFRTSDREFSDGSAGPGRTSLKAQRFYQVLKAFEQMPVDLAMGLSIGIQGRGSCTHVRLMSADTPVSHTTTVWLAVPADEAEVDIVVIAWLEEDLESCFFLDRFVLSSSGATRSEKTMTAVFHIEKLNRFLIAGCLELPGKTEKTIREFHLPMLVR